MNQREFREHVQRALKWLVTEHKYFRELKEALEELKQDIDAAKEQVASHSRIRRDIKKIRNYEKGIIKFEKRFAKQEHDIENMLLAAQKQITISGNLHQNNLLIQKLRHDTQKLMKAVNRYINEIKKYGNYIKSCYKHRQFEQAQQVLIEIENVIDDALTWMQLCATDLKSANRMHKEFAYAELESNYELKAVMENFVQFWTAFTKLYMRFTKEPLTENGKEHLVGWADNLLSYYENSLSPHTVRNLKAPLTLLKVQMENYLEIGKSIPLSYYEEAQGLIAKEFDEMYKHLGSDKRFPFI